MGTEITLDVGVIELTYAKNHPGMDHGCLFHECNRKIHAPSDDQDPCSSYFQTTVAEVVTRVEMLGHTLASARQEYEVAVDIARRKVAEFFEYSDNPGETPKYLTFDQLLDVVRDIPASRLSTDIDDRSQNPKRIAIPKTLGSLPWEDMDSYIGRSFESDSIYSESTSAEYILGGFDPYTAIRLLAENPENLHATVTWDYGPLVGAGWAEEEEFNISLDDRRTFLIITEGSSDAAILRHAIKLLMPEVGDFFRYIDMEEGYPFSGTGQLHKFIQGLIAMRVPLNVVAIYDNDAEGYATYLRTKELKLPSSYRTTMLPELPELAAFPTSGPRGEVNCDINRRAASLECYLDLNRTGLPPALIQWGAFNESVELYQGALKSKTQFMKDFLAFKGLPNRHGKYDMDKLRPVVKRIVDTCVSIAEATRLGNISEWKR